MSLIEQATAITLLIDFLLGVAFGVIGSASVASRREDRIYSLLHAPPDPVCEGARAIHGVYSRGDGFTSDVLRGTAGGGDNVTGGGGGGGGGDGGASAQGQEPKR
jgi:hypothetical protein